MTVHNFFKIWLRFLPMSMNPVWNPFTDRETKGMITGDLRNKTCVDSGGWPLLAIARSKLIHGSWFCTQARYVCVRRAYIFCRRLELRIRTLRWSLGVETTVMPFDTLNTVDCQWCAKVRCFTVFEGSFQVKYAKERPSEALNTPQGLYKASSFPIYLYIPLEPEKL